MFVVTVLQGRNINMHGTSNCECSNKAFYLLLFQNIAYSYDLSVGRDSDSLLAGRSGDLILVGARFSAPV